MRVNRSVRVGLRQLRTHNSLPVPYDLHSRSRQVQDSERPQKRCDCVDAPRPCPFVGCRYHLYLDVDAKGAIIFRYPRKAVEDLKETCALDIADRGEHRLEEIGNIFGVTRERVRQIEYGGLEALVSSDVLKLYHDQSDADCKE